MTVRILTGDCRDILKTLPDESVHCCVTSPPYWGLRDYGAIGQLGQEETFWEFLDTMVDVFREVRRVLRTDGTAWINMGDAYANDGKWGGATGGKHADYLHGQASRIGREKRRTGLKPKDLIGQPWRLAFALQEDGWWLRRDIIWHKQNPMPESVRDRPTGAHEYIFLMTKAQKYFYDADAILEPVSLNTHARLSQDVAAHVGSARANGGAKSNGNMKAVGRAGKTQPAGDRLIKNNESFASGTSMPVTERNKRTVWTVATEAFRDAHFAAFPPALIEPCIKAGCPQGGGSARSVRWGGHHGTRRRQPSPQRHPDRTESRICRDGRATHRQSGGAVRRHAARTAAVELIRNAGARHRDQSWVASRSHQTGSA